MKNFKAEARRAKRKYVEKHYKRILDWLLLSLDKCLTAYENGEIKEDISPHDFVWGCFGKDKKLTKDERIFIGVNRTLINCMIQKGVNKLTALDFRKYVKSDKGLCLMAKFARKPNGKTIAEEVEAYWDEQ